MVTHRRLVGTLAALLALALAAAACGGDDDTPGTGDDAQQLTGTISISGSSTVEPISALVAELFNEDYPDVQIRVDGPGTGDGFELFCAGDTDISDASRPIEDDEAAACEDAGVAYTELEVALDGVTLLTNPASPVECLTTGDIYALFGPESEGFANWDDANQLAMEVGGAAGFPDAPLEITAPGEESGTYDAFIELTGIPDVALDNGVAEDEAEALRKDYQASPNDNVIIQAIEGSESALGFVGFAFAETAGEGVKEIAVDAGEGCIEPSAETIVDGSYPLSRSLYIYVNTDRIAQSEALAAYVDLYVSDLGLGEAVSSVGYIPLPADRQEATRRAWEDAAA